MAVEVKICGVNSVEAAQAAVSSPLLEETSIQGARGVLINITGGSDLLLHEVSEASGIIYEAAHTEANIIFGAVLDEDMKDEVKITVIATGFEHAGADRTLQQVPKALGGASDADLEVPAFLRRATN